MKTVFVTRCQDCGKLTAAGAEKMDAVVRADDQTYALVGTECGYCAGANNVLIGEAALLSDENEPKETDTIHKLNRIELNIKKMSKGLDGIEKVIKNMARRA